MAVAVPYQKQRRRKKMDTNVNVIFDALATLTIVLVFVSGILGATSALMGTEILHLKLRVKALEEKSK